MRRGGGEEVRTLASAGSDANQTHTTYQTRGVAARPVAAVSAVGQGALLATLLVALLGEGGGGGGAVRLNKLAEANTLLFVLFFNSPLSRRSRTPLPLPRSRCRTR